MEIPPSFFFFFFVFFFLEKRTQFKSPKKIPGQECRGQIPAKLVVGARMKMCPVVMDSLQNQQGKKKKTKRRRIIKQKQKNVSANGRLKPHVPHAARKLPSWPAYLRTYKPSYLDYLSTYRFAHIPTRVREYVRTYALRCITLHCICTHGQNIVYSPPPPVF